MPQIENPPDTLHVFAIDAPMADAQGMALDGAALSAAFGGIEIEPDRADVIDTTQLGELGLSSYLVEGEGADPDTVRQSAGRLDAHRGPTLILRPGAANAPLDPQAPLTHLGSFQLARAAPPGPAIRTASAEGDATGVPTSAPEPGRNDRRTSGAVATAALVAALLIVVIVWLVAI